MYLRGVYMSSNNYREMLIKNNIKTSKQRELIFDILENSDEPLTVEEIFFQLAEKENSMNLSTIYRILNVFISKGLVVKSNIYNNKAVFELRGNKHTHHLTCVCCGKILVMDNCPLNGYEKSLEEMTSFDITSHKLELFGVCPECKIKKEKNSAY